MSLEKLKSQVFEITKSLKKLNFDDAGFIGEINKALPPESSTMNEFSALARQGAKEGWLCDRENGDIKFSRVCKSTAESNNFSCDAVWMASCSGPKHTHPNGELSFCINIEGNPNFDGFGPGWALYKPGTTHVPTVQDGTMLILYFLPEGSVKWE